MATVQGTGSRDMSLSAFPLSARTDIPAKPWHGSYPENVPPGLVFPEMRTEELLRSATALYPNRIAINYFATSWTYSELLERVRVAAANFQRLGVVAGDRVLMVLPNCPEYVVSWFALHWIGAQVVPANPLCSGSDLVHLVKRTGARVVLGLDFRIGPVVELTQRYPMQTLVLCSLAPHLPLKYSLPYKVKTFFGGRIRAGHETQVIGFEEILSNRVTPLKEPVLQDPDLPAVLQPTGGTTGVPKIAVLSHRNLAANISQLHVWSGLGGGNETVLAVIPFFHVFGTTVGLLSSIAGGATIAMLARFEPSMVLKTVKKWEPTVAPLVPFMFVKLSEEIAKTGQPIKGPRLCMAGAAPLTRDIHDEFMKWTGSRIVEGYGLSEASPVTHTNPPDENARVGTIGLPLPDTDARVVDVKNPEVEVEPGQVGELLIRGPQVMQGYLDDTTSTRQVIRDGWLHTGDLVCMDEDGFFTVVDRKKDMIISGGLNIYPTEVEHVLSRHRSVRQCAVVGIPDRTYGEKVVGYVVALDKAHVDPTQLQAHCREELASYKVPRSIEFCDELPTNFLGKVRRVELREHGSDASDVTPGSESTSAEDNDQT